jgi:hypothetical protein
MKRATLLLASVALAACASTPEQDAINALPQAESVAIGQPVPSGHGGMLQPGQTSDFYQTTYLLSTSVNAGVGWVLGLVRAITTYPATSCSTDSCTWGPHTTALDPNTWELTVTRQDNPLQFQYTLSAEPKSHPELGFIPILTGTAQPSGIPHRGKGTFTVDFDADQRLDEPQSKSGTLTATYDNNGPLVIQVAFLHTDDVTAPGRRVNVQYDYADDSSGGGDLQVAWGDTNNTDTFSLHSRWLNTGAGRGDDQLNAPTISIQGTASECWGTDFSLLYYTSTDPNVGSGGDSSKCAFPTAIYASISPPTS